MEIGAADGADFANAWDMNKQLSTPCRLIVVTGGPGAGKTAVLETARRMFPPKVAVLPEAASIVFGGGFWRLESASARDAAQRAIFHVQREMETLVCEEGTWTAGICDRGTLDGLAYWRGREDDFWRMTGTTLARELARYHAVIHLRSPAADGGYNHRNPLRIETAEEASAIDRRIAEIWSSHPRYCTIESTESFITKAERALGILGLQLEDAQE